FPPKLQCSVSDSFITRRKCGLRFKVTPKAAIIPSELETDQGYDRPLAGKRNSSRKDELSEMKSSPVDLILAGSAPDDGGRDGAEPIFPLSVSPLQTKVLEILKIQSDERRGEGGGARLREGRHMWRLN
ncbi:hypothetical protein KUCAC02_004545, partial [Chaenocephalus aceratus]